MANKKVSQLTSKPAVNLTDLFLIADPTSGQAFKTTISDLGTAIGSGVSSVNTLVGAVVLDTDDIQELASPTNRWFTDTRARAALSASSPLAYNSGTGVFSIPAATSSQNGYLTSTDWTTFNNKLSPATAASTYLPLVLSTTAKSVDINGQQFTISGSTGGVFTSGRLIVDPDFSGIGYQTAGVFAGLTFTTAGAAIFSNSGIIRTLAANSLEIGYSSQQGAGFKLDINGTARFTGDVTLSSANPRLYFTDSDNNPDYFISNTDGTFTVYDVTNSTSRFTIGTTGNGTFGGNLTVGQIIRSGGTSSQFLKADGSVDSSTYLTTGTASSTYLPLGGGTLTGALFATSASFSGFVGFGGNTSPLAAIDVTGAGRFSSTISAAGATLTGALSGTSATFSGDGSFGSGASDVTITIPTNNSGSGYAGRILGKNSTGQLIIQHRDNSATFVNAITISSGGGVPVVTLGGTLGVTGAATFSSSVTANSTNGVAGVFKSDTFFGSIDLENTGGTATGKWNLQAVSGAQVGATAGSSFGIYSYGASAYRMFITSAGNVGIGTTAPATRLQINDAGSGAYTMLTIHNRQTRGAGVGARINLLPNNDFTAGVDTGAAISAVNSSGGTANDVNLIFETSSLGTGAERMRITSDGNLLVGTTTNAGEKLRVNGNLRALSLYSSSAGLSADNWTQLGHDDNVGFINVNRIVNSGDLHFRFDGTSRANINRSTGAYTATSDSRLKTNISDSQSVLSLINKIKVRSYKWIENDINEAYGLIAQELYEILPEYVYKPKIESENWGLSKAELVPMLVKAVQELKAKIETLENK